MFFNDKSNKLTPEQISELKETFSEMDKDGNGFITATELKEALEDLGEPVSDYVVDELIRQADANKDGKISFEGIKLLFLKSYI